jgi:RNA polymerase sigma-70 factor (ECF subfamily)
MTDLTLHTEADQDRVILEIYAHLQDAARWFLDEVDMDDLVQDIIVKCLVAYRKGRWTRAPISARAFAWKAIMNHVIRRYLTRIGTAARDGQHLSDREAMPPAWMSPDRHAEERQIALIHRQLVSALPPRCRAVYRMVREEGASYEQIASRLDVSRGTVHSHIVAAQRAFRAELRRRGYVCRNEGVARRPRRSDSWGSDAHFAPGYSGPLRVHAAKS